MASYKTGIPWRAPLLSDGAIGDRILHLTLAPADGVALEAVDVHWQPAYRIIASEYAGENLFDRLLSGSDAEDLQAIADFTSAARTADADADRGFAPPLSATPGAPHTKRLATPFDAIADMRAGHWKFGRGAGLIMSAFAWPGAPSRFSDGRRGTFYATNTEQTAVAETRYHDARFLAGSGPVTLSKTVVEATLAANLVDVRAGRPAPQSLDDPLDYAMGQSFGAVVRRLGGDGILYDSVRHRGQRGRVLGQCAAVFRPTALSNAVAVRKIEYRWDGGALEAVR